VRLVFFFAVGFLLFSLKISAQGYDEYHARIREIDRFLLDQDWGRALEKYLELEGGYDFLFIRDLKVAGQLAYRTGDSTAFHRFSKAAFVRGWDWRKVKKELRDNPDFALGMRSRLKAISKKTERREFTNPEIREQVKKLFLQDQWQALGALLVFPSERRERYVERKIAADARLRADAIWRIVDEIGYPGEMKIGNFVWATTLLSHYNSISDEFVKADTLYPAMRSILRKELAMGRISPFEFALIDNWYQSVSSDRTIESYGILEGEVTPGALSLVNDNRQAVGLPTVEDHNQLLQLQSNAGIKLFFGQAWGSNSPIRIGR
jgi:hypothetical protein